jgi:hypothetical protein
MPVRDDVFDCDVGDGLPGRIDGISVLWTYRCPSVPVGVMHLHHATHLHAVQGRRGSAIGSRLPILHWYSSLQSIFLDGAS